MEESNRMGVEMETVSSDKVSDNAVSSSTTPPIDDSDDYFVEIDEEDGASCPKKAKEENDGDDSVAEKDEMNITNDWHSFSLGTTLSSLRDFNSKNGSLEENSQQGADKETVTSSDSTQTTPESKSNADAFSTWRSGVKEGPSQPPPMSKKAKKAAALALAAKATESNTVPQGLAAKASEGNTVPQGLAAKASEGNSVPQGLSRRQRRKMKRMMMMPPPGNASNAAAMMKKRMEENAKMNLQNQTATNIEFADRLKSSAQKSSPLQGQIQASCDQGNAKTPVSSSHDFDYRNMSANEVPPTFAFAGSSQELKMPNNLSLSSQADCDYRQKQTDVVTSTGQVQLVPHPLVPGVQIRIPSQQSPVRPPPSSQPMMQTTTGMPVNLPMSGGQQIMRPGMPINQPISGALPMIQPGPSNQQMQIQGLMMQPAPGLSQNQAIPRAQQMIQIGQGIPVNQPMPGAPQILQSAPGMPQPMMQPVPGMCISQPMPISGPVGQPVAARQPQMLVTVNQSSRQVIVPNTSVPPPQVVVVNNQPTVFTGPNNMPPPGVVVATRPREPVQLVMTSTPPPGGLPINRPPLTLISQTLQAQQVMIQQQLRGSLNQQPVSVGISLPSPVMNSPAQVIVQRPPAVNSSPHPVVNLSSQPAVQTQQLGVRFTQVQSLGNSVLPQQIVMVSQQMPIQQINPSSVVGNRLPPPVVVTAAKLPQQPSGDVDMRISSGSPMPNRTSTIISSPTGLVQPRGPNAGPVTDQMASHDVDMRSTIRPPVPSQQLPVSSPSKPVQSSSSSSSSSSSTKPVSSSSVKPLMSVVACPKGHLAENQKKSVAENSHSAKLLTSNMLPQPTADSACKTVEPLVRSGDVDMRITPARQDQQQKGVNMLLPGPGRGEMPPQMRPNLPHPLNIGPPGVEPPDFNPYSGCPPQFRPPGMGPGLGPCPGPMPFDNFRPPLFNGPQPGPPPMWGGPGPGNFPGPMPFGNPQWQPDPYRFPMPGGPPGFQPPGPGFQPPGPGFQPPPGPGFCPGPPPPGMWPAAPPQNFQQPGFPMGAPGPNWQPNMPSIGEGPQETKSIEESAREWAEWSRHYADWYEKYYGIDLRNSPEWRTWLNASSKALQQQQEPSIAPPLPPTPDYCAPPQKYGTSSDTAGPPPEPDAEENETIIINNIPTGTKAIDVRELVSKYGKIVNCKVGRMKSQKEGGGLFALVVMQNFLDASKVISCLNFTEFRGQSISVCKMNTR